MLAVSRASRHSVGVLIGLLVLAGVALPPRVWRLSSNPPSLGADELAMVVSWESIVRTGRVETLWARKEQYDLVCLGTVSWYHEPTFRAYSLRDFPRPITIDPEDPAGVVLEHVVRDPSGAALFTVYGIRR